MNARHPKRSGRPIDAELKARRQEQILDEAARLFSEVGFHEADTQALADRLKVGKGTIYRYFPSKEKLFLASVDRVMHRLKQALNQSVEGVTDPLEHIIKAIYAYLAFFSANPSFVELLIQERAEFKDRKKPTYFEHRDANLGKWEELFRSLIHEGVFRDVPVERIVNVISDLVYGTMFTNYFTGRRSSFEQQANDILDIVFQGVLTEEGRQRFEAGKEF